MSNTLRGLEYTGLRELNAALKKAGTDDAAIKEVMTEAGELIRGEAWRLVPVRTGNLAASLKVSKSKNQLEVKVGNNKTGSTGARYGYTFHAVALGKSRGGFTFDVPSHTRGGYPVRAYTAKRYIPNKPFLFMAFERKKQAVYETYVKGIGRLLQAAGLQ